MDRPVAWEELSLRIDNPNLLRHSLAVEAVMRGMAVHFGDDVELWGLAGLLHDIDLERVRDCPERHALLGAEILTNLDADPTLIYAVRAHNPALGLERRRNIDKALFAADAAASLVVKTALSRAEKRLTAIDAAQCLQYGVTGAFSHPAGLKALDACADMGLTAEAVVELAIDAMTGIREELGL